MSSCWCKGRGADRRTGLPGGTPAISLCSRVNSSPGAGMQTKVGRLTLSTQPRRQAGSWSPGQAAHSPWALGHSTGLCRFGRVAAWSFLALTPAPTPSRSTCPRPQPRPVLRFPANNAGPQGLCGGLALGTASSMEGGEGAVGAVGGEPSFA